MRIGILTNSYPPNLNGVSVAVANLEKALTKLGHSIFVVTPQVPGVIYAENVLPLKSYSAPSHASSDLRMPYDFISQTVKFLQQNQVEILHSQDTLVGGVESVIIAMKLKIPCVHTYHTMVEDYDYFNFPGYRLFIRNYSQIVCDGHEAVVAVSPKTEEYLRKIGVSSQIIQIPNVLKLSQEVEIETHEIIKSNQNWNEIESKIENQTETQILNRKSNFSSSNEQTSDHQLEKKSAKLENGIEKLNHNVDINKISEEFTWAENSENKVENSKKLYKLGILSEKIFEKTKWLKNYQNSNTQNSRLERERLEKWLDIGEQNGGKLNQKLEQKLEINLEKMLIWSENWSGKFFGKSGLRSESKTMESGSQEENLEMGDVLENLARLNIEGRLEKSFNFLTFGRVAKEKSLDLGIQVLRPLLEKYPNINYLIAGSGPEINALQKQIKELKLENRVFLIGKYTSQTLPKICQYCDVFINTSSSENLPTTDFEALSFGLPIITVDDPAHQFFVNSCNLENWKIGDKNSKINQNLTSNPQKSSQTSFKNSSFEINLDEKNLEESENKDLENGFWVSIPEMTKTCEKIYLDSKLRQKLSTGAKKTAKKLADRAVELEYLDLYQKLIDEHKKEITPKLNGAEKTLKPLFNKFTKMNKSLEKYWQKWQKMIRTDWKNLFGE
jgi:glycosyltransferase involved in cell wall biosynthesis